MAMAGALTREAYARRRGVRTRAVHNFIAREQLTAPALREDGLIDPDLADDQLDERLNPVQSAGARQRVDRAPPVDGGSDPSAARQLLRARAISASVDAARKRRAFDLERGRYMLTATAQVEWNKALAEFLLGLEQSFPDLATDLGLDRTKTAVLRKWWRDQRTKAAANFAATAAATDEFVEEDAA